MQTVDHPTKNLCSGSVDSVLVFDPVVADMLSELPQSRLDDMPGELTRTQTHSSDYSSTDQLQARNTFDGRCGACWQ